MPLSAAPIVISEIKVLIWVLVAASIAAALAWLGHLPGARARACGHPESRSINLLGWIGVVIWPLWIIAMVRAARISRQTIEMPELFVPVTCPRVRHTSRTAIR